MGCMSQNLRLFHVSNFSVRNLLIFLLMYPGSLYPCLLRSALVTVVTLFGTWGDMVYMVTVPNTCFKGGNKRPCCTLHASF